MSAIENEEKPLNAEVNDEDDPNFAEFQRLKREIRDAHRSRSKWRTEAQQCFDYVAGHQWSDEDKAKLDAENRPAVVFNRTEPLVKAVCGLEVNNRQGVVFLPRNIGSSGVNEMITNTGKWIREECNAEDEESESFRDMVICGEGWTETRIDFDEDPLGKIVKERLDPLEMGVNKGASRANYMDARLIYRVREMDPEDVRALLDLPDDIEDAALDARWLDEGTTPEDGGAGNKKDYPDKTRAGVGSGRRGGLKTVKVIQCQYWKREPVYMVATDGDEEPMQLNEEEFATFQERADAIQLDYKHARTTKKCYYECFIGVRILDMRKMEMGMFQFEAMTGDRDRKLKCFYGMVRIMIDPQQWGNKFLSQTMHHVNVNAKGGLLAETDAFLDKNSAERDWADPTKIVWAKPGSLQKQKIKERTAIALPPGLDQLMMFAISSIRDVTGINLELLGQADREQAASLEQQRRQSAMTILATMFDSLRRYRKRDGRLMLHFIWLLPEGTLVRVVDQGQYKYIPLIKDGLELEKFDIVIDQAPNSPDQKQFVWAITAQILQMNILPPPAIIELLKYSPYPESVVIEIRKALGIDGEMPPDQLKQKLAQAEQALQVLEQKLQEAQKEADSADKDREIELLRIQIDDYKAETERLKAQWDARIKLAGQIATGEEGQVTTGSEQLPDIGAPARGGNEEVLNQKIDALANMVQSLVASLGQQQPAPVPAPVGEPPMEQL